MSLSECFPQPTPIVLRGGRWLARQLQLRHMVELESLAMLHGGDPLDTLGDTSDRPAYRARLRDLYDALREHGGAYSWGSPGCDAFVFGTDAGLAAYLGYVLRDHPGIDAGTVASLAATLEPDEWAAVDRLAFGAEAIDEIQRRIDRECGAAEVPADAGHGTPISWPEAVAEACKILRATPAEIAELYIGQFRMVRTGGKPRDLDDVRPPKGWSHERFNREVARPRREFWKEGMAAKESAPTRPDPRTAPSAAPAPAPAGPQPGAPGPDARQP